MDFIILWKDDTVRMVYQKSSFSSVFLRVRNLTPELYRTDSSPEMLWRFSGCIVSPRRVLLEVTGSVRAICTRFWTLRRLISHFLAGVTRTSTTSRLHTESTGPRIFPSIRKIFGHDNPRRVLKKRSWTSKDLWNRAQIAHTPPVNSRNTRRGDTMHPDHFPSISGDGYILYNSGIRFGWFSDP